MESLNASTLNVVLKIREGKYLYLIGVSINYS